MRRVFKISDKAIRNMIPLILCNAACGIIYAQEGITKDTTVNIPNDTTIHSNLHLKELVVKGNRPVIKREIDRLVFNVANSPIAQGNDLIDLLRQTPLVKVTDDAISIVGKDNVKIMLNGKISYLDKNDLMNYLKTLQSDDIVRIEVITTPPAKYDAEGNGGLINIVTRKRQNAGWHGTIGTSYTQRTYAGISSNAAINYSPAKSFFALKLRQSNQKGRINENYTIQQLNARQARYCQAAHNS